MPLQSRADLVVFTSHSNISISAAPRPFPLSWTSFQVHSVSNMRNFWALAIVAFYVSLQAHGITSVKCSSKLGVPGSLP